MAGSVDKIRVWLRGRGYRLMPGAGYACFWHDRIITHRTQDTTQTQVSGLLHECGHVMVERTLSGTRYARGYPGPKTGRARPNTSAADLVHEEIEAWHRGWALGRRLRLRVDSDKYWLDYDKYVKRYMRRAVDRSV